MKNEPSAVTIPTSEYETLKSEIAELTQKVEWLMEQLKLSKHRQFGVSSEKSAYDQISLFNEAETTADVNIVEPRERFEKRQKLSKPVVDEFFAWLEALEPMPKTPIGVAAHYAISQRKYLEHYLLDGRLELSNNRAERSIKPFVIDRKNFLFANTPRGAKASAVMFSLIETAKETGLNPFSYLTYIFQNAPNWDIRNRMDMLELLMPWNAPNQRKAFSKV